MSLGNRVFQLLSLLFMVPISLVPALALLYFYVSTFRSMCAVPKMTFIIIIITIIYRESGRDVTAFWQVMYFCFFFFSFFFFLFFPPLSFNCCLAAASQVVYSVGDIHFYKEQKTMKLGASVMYAFTVMVYKSGITSRCFKHHLGNHHTNVELLPSSLDLQEATTRLSSLAGIYRLPT